MKFNFVWGPITVLLIWFLVTQFEWIDPFLFPSPIRTFSKFPTLFTEDAIHWDLLSTLKRVSIAFSLSVVIALPVGLIIGRLPKVYQRVELLIDFFRSTPAAAVFPLFLIIFGVSDESKIAAGCFAALFIILFNVAYGVMHVKKTRIQAAKLDGASEWYILTHIVLWESLPQTLIGLRSALANCLIVIVLTEMLIGTDYGIGKKSSTTRSLTSYPVFMPRSYSLV